MTGSVWWRAVLVLATLITIAAGCGESLQEIDPDRALVFRIPVGQGEGDSTLCLFSVPAGYHPGRSWPAVITLHGYGSSAARFHMVWRGAASASGFVLVTPQGEEPTGEGVGWSWGEHAEETVRRSLEAVTGTVRIDRSRIFLAGFSQGGTLTYDLALRHPHLFKGIAPIGAGRRLPGAERLDLLSGMRVYIGHGELEPRLEEVRQLADELRARGCTVLLREYAGVGHALPDSAHLELRHLLTFLATNN